MELSSQNNSWSAADLRRVVAGTLITTTNANSPSAAAIQGIARAESYVDRMVGPVSQARPQGWITTKHLDRSCVTRPRRWTGTDRTLKMREISSGHATPALSGIKAANWS